MFKSSVFHSICTLSRIETELLCSSSSLFSTVRSYSDSNGVPLLLCSPLWGVTPTQTGFLFFSVLHREELLRLERGSSSSLFSTVRSYSDSNGVPLLLCSPPWGVTPTQTGFPFFSVLHREELLRLKRGSSSSLFSTVRSYSDSNGVPLLLCSPPWGVTPTQTGFLFFSVLHREELLRLKRGSSSSLFSTVRSYSDSNGVPLLLCSPPWGDTPTQTGVPLLLCSPPWGVTPTQTGFPFFSVLHREELLRLKRGSSSSLFSTVRSYSDSNGFLFFSVLHREELLRLKRGSPSSLFSTVRSYSDSNGVPLLLCSPPWGVTPTQTGFLFFSVLHREELPRLKRGSSSSLFSTVKSYPDSNGVPLLLCSPPWGDTPTQTGFLFFSVLHREELLRLKRGSPSSLFSTVRSYSDSNGVPLLLCSPPWGVTPTQTGFLFFSVLHREELLRLKRGSPSSLFSTVRSYSDSNGVPLLLCSPPWGVTPTQTGVPLLLCSPPWGVTPTQTGFLFFSVLHREELPRLKRGSSSSLFSTVRSYPDSNGVPLLLCSPPWGVTPTQTGFLFFSVLHREELPRLKRGSSSSLFSTVRSYPDSNGVPLLLCSPPWGVTPTQTGFLFFSVLRREELPRLNGVPLLLCSPPWGVTPTQTGFPFFSVLRREELLRLKRGSSSSLFSAVRSYSDSNGVPLLLCSPPWGVTPTQTGFLFFSVLRREELLRPQTGFLFFSVLRVRSYSDSNGVPLLLRSPPWGVTPTQTGFLFFSVLRREELLRLKRVSSSSPFSAVRSYSDSNGVPLFSVLRREELLRLKRGSSSSPFSAVRSYSDSNGVPLLLRSPPWRSYSDSNGVPLLLRSPPWGVTPTQTGFLFFSVLRREELLRLKRGSSSSPFSAVRSYSDSNGVPLLLRSPPWGVTPTQTGFLFFSVLHCEELLRLKRGSSSSPFSAVTRYSDSNGVPLLLRSPLWRDTPTQTGFLFFSVLRREELLRLKRGSSSSLFSAVRSYSDSNGVPLLLCSPPWGVTPTQTGFLFFSVLHCEELLRLKRGSSSSPFSTVRSFIPISPVLKNSVLLAQDSCCSSRSVSQTLLRRWK